jgi:hypothetical protein
MNKKLLFAGALAVVSYITLTAFDGKTLEQQKAEIAQMVTSKLDAHRSELQAACDARVEAEAQTRYEAVLAARAEEAAKAPAAKPGVAKTKTKPKAGKGGPKAEPLPAPTPPAPTKTQTDVKKDKMQGTPNTQEKQDKMQGAPANTDKKKAKMQGGGK